MTAASAAPAGPAGRDARPAGRGQRRAGRRKVAVLEAAGRVIAERGADATRFADVAAESGVPVSTLQYYFGSREDLLVAAFRHASGTEIAALEAEIAGAGRPVAAARPHRRQRAVAGYEAAATGSGRLWIESWHFGIRDAEMRADAVRDYGAWRGLVADVVRRGRDGRPVRAAGRAPSSIAVLTIALVDGVGIPLALGDPEITADGAVGDVLAALDARVLHPARAVPRLNRRRAREPAAWNSAAEAPASGSRPAIVSRITGALARSRSSRLAEPVSTPATSPAPARSPDSTSLAVSPATASSLTAPPPSRSSAVSGRSGQGRPRPASAGESARSISGRQPSASSRASLVAGENPVARQTLIPAARSAAKVSTAPGSGATAPARTDAA